MSSLSDSLTLSDCLWFKHTVYKRVCGGHGRPYVVEQGGSHRHRPDPQNSPLRAPHGHTIFTRMDSKLRDTQISDIIAWRYNRPAITTRTSGVSWPGTYQRVGGVGSRLHLYLLPSVKLPSYSLALPLLTSPDINSTTWRSHSDIILLMSIKNL